MSNVTHHERCKVVAILRSQEAKGKARLILALDDLQKKTKGKEMWHSRTHTWQHLMGRRNKELFFSLA